MCALVFCCISFFYFVGRQQINQKRRKNCKRAIKGVSPLFLLAVYGFTKDKNKVERITNYCKQKEGQKTHTDMSQSDFKFFVRFNYQFKI